MQLDFLQAVVSLRFIVHIEDLKHISVRAILSGIESHLNHLMLTLISLRATITLLLVCLALKT